MAHSDARASELFPGVAFNILTMELVTTEKRVRLTSTECNLLELFLENQRRVHTKDEIAYACCGPGSSSRAVGPLVYRLRNKMCTAGLNIPRKDTIMLVRGKGYKLGATAH